MSQKVYLVISGISREDAKTIHGVYINKKMAEEKLESLKEDKLLGLSKADWRQKYDMWESRGSRYLYISEHSLVEADDTYPKINVNQKIISNLFEKFPKEIFCAASDCGKLEGKPCKTLEDAEDDRNYYFGTSGYIVRYVLDNPQNE